MEKHMTLRLDDNLADMIKIMAKRERSSASELVRKAIQTYFLIDPTLIRKARRLAVGLGVTSIEVIGNLAVGRLAELEARREVWGATGEVLDEFFTLDGETPDGQTLFDILKQGHLQKERVKKKESEYHGPPKDE